MKEKTWIEDNDLFDIWMNLGIIISGRSRHLELFLTKIKSNPNLKICYVKTSAGKLTIKEDIGEGYYENEKHIDDNHVKKKP